MIRNPQIDDILNSLLATGHFERIDQDLAVRFNDPYTKQVPRLRDIRCEPSLFCCINLWTETVYMLRVDAIELIAIKDIDPWNPVLAEERFATIPETACLTRVATIQNGISLSLDLLSSSHQFPTFIPSIPWDL